MIERNQYQLNYIKKENQSGSFHGMRFTFQKSEDGLKTTVYPEPFCLDSTPEDQRTVRLFPFSNEGLDTSIEWLNEIYETKKPFWMEAAEKM